MVRLIYCHRMLLLHMLYVQYRYKVAVIKRIVQYSFLLFSCSIKHVTHMSSKTFTMLEYHT